MNNKLSIERFNDALQHKGWTMKRLAEEYDQAYPNESGKSIYNTLRKWNTGKGNPTLEKLVRVCDLLECDIDYLIGRMDNHTHTTKFICDQTGLAESSVDKLIEKKDTCGRALNILFSLEERQTNQQLFVDNLLPLVGIYYYMCYNHLSFVNEDNDLSDEEAKSKSHEMFEQNQVCQYRISNTVSRMIDEIRETAFDDYAQTKGLERCPHYIPYKGA